MHTHYRNSNLLKTFTRAAMVTFLAATGSVYLNGQVQTTSTGSSTPELQATLKAPLDLTVPEGVGYSSSTGVEETAAAERFNLSGAADADTQPPPRRRRYGRPNYNDRMHNADGSNKVAFVVGGGFDLPVGATGKRTTLSYHFMGGAGLNFSKKLGVLAEYNYDNFGLQGNVLSNQTALYNYYDYTDGYGNPVSGLDGSTHVWSLTLNPILTLASSNTSSFYFVFGGGFYRKVVTFTIPGVGEYCDPYYGYCYEVQQNQVYDHYSNNAGGVNGGFGITHNFSRFSNEKFFAEARYVQVFNTTSKNSVNSLYPPANARTGYIPVTVGLRW